MKRVKNNNFESVQDSRAFNNEIEIRTTGSPKKEVYSYIGQPQESKKIPNKQFNSTPKGT